jgi:hypothetical protein
VLLHLHWPLATVIVLCAVLLSLLVAVSRYSCTAWAYLAVVPALTLDFTGRFSFSEHHSGLEAGRCLQSMLLLLLLLLMLNVLPRVKHSGINTVDHLILVACVASASKQSKIFVG